MNLYNVYELSSSAVEEGLDRMTTVYTHIHKVLKCIHYGGSTLNVEKARQFNIDNWVLVERRRVQVEAGNNKSLIRKWHGHYKVIKAIGSHGC